MTTELMATTILVYIVIFGVMIMVAYFFVTFANMAREVKQLRYENDCQKEKLKELGYERNLLREELDNAQRKTNQSHALEFFVRDCEMEKILRENRKLKAFCETYRKQLEIKEKKNA